MNDNETRIQIAAMYDYVRKLERRVAGCELSIANTTELGYPPDAQLKRNYAAAKRMLATARKVFNDITAE